MPRYEVLSRYHYPLLNGSFNWLYTYSTIQPLIESGKPIAEAIEKIQVHCLYHRSGCQWQGTLSECITHCTSCTFGNSPVVCNRCGTQIVHRQVQEHAQTCPVGLLVSHLFHAFNFPLLTFMDFCRGCSLRVHLFKIRLRLNQSLPFRRSHIPNLEQAL